MGGSLRRLRSGTTRANLSFRKRLSRLVATRIAGAAVGTAGIALMGIGTVGSPVASGGGAQLMSVTLTSVSGISVSCTDHSGTNTATGSVTVTNPQDGETLKLQVFYHTPGSSVFVPILGAFETLNISASTTSYSYSISFAPVFGANTYRVQIVDATPQSSWNTDSLNTKSDSFSCGVATTTTTTTTKTTTPTTTTTTTTTNSAGSSTSSTTTTTTHSAGSSTASTTAKTTTTSVTSGVAGATTSTPSTGANVAFGVGLGLLIIGGGLLFGARPLLRRWRK